jgi:Rrf2 family protein
MNLRLTKRGDYAVRAAVALGRAFDDSGYRKIREVAEDMELPLRYTPQILGLLARAGLAQARAGRDGGYRLQRDPGAISLLEIVEAAEGPLRPERCTLSGGPCHWEQMCAVHPAWEDAARAFRHALGQVTLAQVIDVDRGLESNSFPVPDDAHRKETARKEQERKASGSAPEPSG